MNPKALLVISLIINVALGAALMKPATPPSGAETAGSASVPPKAENAKATPAPVAKARVVTQVVTNTLAQKFDWNSVESADYKQYIANLRSIGCPEETIRDIITADVNKLYEARRKELAGPKKKFEFWKPGSMMGAAVDPERIEKERALNKEKRALLTQLLGSAPDEKPDLLASTATQLEAMFDFLPADKRSKVFDLMQDMQTKMQKAMKGGTPDPEDMRKLMKETEAAMAAALTPEEMLDYNLRFSTTANMMRMQLAGFEPTEQEFLDIYKKRKAYDDEFGGAFGGGFNLKGEEKARQEAAKKALDEDIKAQLGDDRYAELKRGEDYAFQTMFRAADREGLGKEAAVKVYDMKKAAEDQARQVRADQTLTSEQRAAALRGIREETERSVKTAFGEKGYATYERNSGTFWLNGISPDPATPKPARKP
ncbi:MAG: hypothetical protein EBS05_15425 [Proteobacteria bacterium]|nr:hypothetical protein [Pseudomonadota bacterium]